ncbi:MAG: M23 family metallopeptidase [Pseudomonadota bacterium]
MIDGLGRAALNLALVTALAGCGGGLGAVGNMFGSNPSEGVPPPIEGPVPDSRGVITYSTYQVIEARGNDTIPDMAERVGLPPEDLASHNGLPLTYRPRPGEVLALPRTVGPAPEGWTPDRAAAALDAAGPAVATDLPPATAANPFSNGQSTPVVEPVRHRVASGETAFSIARLYGVSVTALASWNGLDADLSLRADQELLIPTTGAPPAAQEATLSAQPQPINQPGTRSPVPPPPSAQRPLPENQEFAAVEVPDVDLSANLTPPGASRKLLVPVEGATVLRGYQASGPDKNEGIDYAAPAGTPVRAAEDGEIALISRSLGGLGTIVLVRHPDDLLTVYGRVDRVMLEKGASVTRGQQIGVVADGPTPNLHFEIRRGTDSVDPTPYL